jgi:nucleoside phosphorylase
VATELSCVLVALAREAMYFRLGGRQRLRPAPCRAWIGQPATVPVLLVQTGMGAAPTARALEWVLARKPACVVVAGFCGGLNEALEVGCLVQPGEVCDDQGNTWPVAPAPRIGLPGRLVSVAHPVLSIAGRQALRARTGAVAVDLESATAVRMLHERGIPFCCLRVVSDDARSGLPEDLAAALDGERVRMGGLLRAVLGRPGLVIDLWRMARQSRLAARRLADGIEQMLNQGAAPVSCRAG